MDQALRAVAEAAKGFMPPDEGMALHRAGKEGAGAGPLLEIGTYCGKSAVYLGAAAAEAGTVLYTIDHHRGSEEMGQGWEHHDPEVVDPATGRMDSLPFFRRTMAEAGLEAAVVGIVGESCTVARHWTTPLGLVFIDGGHRPEVAMADYEAWAPKLAGGGLLVIHDVFPDPADGGQGPFRVWQQAVEAGYADAGGEGSLRVLRRP